MPEIIEDNEVDNLSFKKDVLEAKPKRHYIDDDHLTAVLSEWKDRFDEALSKGESRPQLPEAVGEAIYDMSEAMGKRHNFCGYSYLDEMKSDAILNCVKYIHNFNPKKKSDKKGKVSAFGYINMIIWRSFTNRIESEKLEQFLKYKSFELLGGMDAFKDEDMSDLSSDGDDVNIGVLGQDFLSKIAEYEEKHGLNKSQRRDKSIQFDNFMFELVPCSDTIDVEDNLEIEFE